MAHILAAAAATAFPAMPGPTVRQDDHALRQRGARLVAAARRSRPMLDADVDPIPVPTPAPTPAMPAKERDMQDLIWIAITVGLIALTIAYLRLCEKA